MASESPRKHGPRRVRREDPALLTGNARYTDDVSSHDLVHAAIVRSQFANARVAGIDTSAAEALDGVVAVFTGADVAESGIEGTATVEGRLEGMRATDFPMLARDRVRYTGEAVAVVLAEDRYVAHDGADRVDVDYERMGAVTTFEEALAEDAPLVHESFDDNLVYDIEFGDAEAVDEALEDADHVARLELDNNRLHPDAMEPRCALAEYDPDDDRVTVHMSTQVPHRARGRISQFLEIPEERIRVIAPDVGGGFGSKGGAPYAGEPLSAWCAMQVGRPVKWVATRTESHRTDSHGRDLWTDVELGVDDDGRFRGLRAELRGNLGAYVKWRSTHVGHAQTLITGPYDLPAVHCRARCAFTNTTPVAPYRGAGRPEAIYVIERIVEEAAAVTGIDPATIRSRNFIPPDAFPFETATGAVFDSGEYQRAMDLALERVDYDALRERQERLREEGRYLGVGIASFVENTGSTPGRPSTARVEVDAAGRVTAFCGTHDHGQGHGTSFAQLLVDELGVDYDDVEVREGDTDDLPRGVGTFGSRSAAVGGSAVIEAAREVRERARELAADRFETSVEDVNFEAGVFSVEGAPDRSIHIAELAGAGRDGGPSLSATADYDSAGYAFAFGTHVAVVEVDPDTGDVDIERYLAVDDCGYQFNPTIVEGQVHGGVAQGIGQALYEHAVYDGNGTLITGSLQDYALPKAVQLPEIETDDTVTPCPHNPSGAKGVGEGGAIGAPPTVVNAVVDALRPLGIDHVDMPLTPERTWAAIRASEG